MARTGCPFSLVPLKRLSDAEMESEPPRLLPAVHHQARNSIDLVPEIGANRADWRLVAQPGADVVAQIVEGEIPWVGPDIAGVEEQHHAETAPHVRAHFCRHVQEGVAADRQAVAAQGRHLVPSPTAEVRRAAEEVPFEE